MLAPKGTGFLFIRRDAQDRFWTTLASYQWDNYADGAFRFMQYGTGSVPVVEGLVAALQDAFWEKRVRVRAQNDARGVRLSAHLYVSPADIDRVLEVTREVAAKAAS